LTSRYIKDRRLQCNWTQQNRFLTSAFLKLHEKDSLLTLRKTTVLCINSLNTLVKWSVVHTEI